MDVLLRRLYFNKQSPAYLGGKTTLLRIAKHYDATIRLKDINEFLSRQNTYTQHKPIRRVFPRNKIVATGIDSHWQADLCDMRKLKHQNSHYQYILTVVDVLSKHCFAEPIKYKKPQDVTKAFKRILEQSGRIPESLMTDQGNEFKGEFQRFLQTKGIHFYFAPNPVIKAANVERFNRTLKNKIWRYFTENKTKRYVDILPDIIWTINHTISRPIKMRPVDVNQQNEHLVWVRLFGDSMKMKKPFKFQVGAHVRIARWRKIFDKGYTPTFTKEVFTVMKRIPREYPVYKLADKDGDSVKGVFYPEQLVKTI